MELRHGTCAVALLSLALASCTSSSTPDAGANDSGFDSTSNDASASDAADASDALNTTPITGAPDDQWTWVEFPTAVCASGTSTGIAINPHAGATNLMIFFEGGGSCTDATTCWGPDAGATNLAGFDQTTFEAQVTGNKLVPTLLRQTNGNPFAAMNMVYVPYCTGDLHSGTTLANLTQSDGGSIPTYFYGALDMDIFLARLVPTFPSMTRLWIVGTSAGGFGTYLNFNRVTTAFGVGADIIDDSGPPLVENGSPTSDNATLFNIWGTNAGLPTCTGCNSFRDVLDNDFTVQQSFSPPGQFGFLSFLDDIVISKDFGYDAGSQYPAVMESFSASLPDSGLAATFLVSNYPSHVVQSDPVLAAFYMPWMTNMVNRDGGFVDETHDGGM